MMGVSNAITAMFVAGGKLYLVTESGLCATASNGLEPRDWTQEAFTGPISGLDAEFRGFYFREVWDIIGGCVLSDKEKENLKEAIHIMVLEGLMRAFAELQTIRSNKNKQLPKVDRERPYENFARTLWHSYRHLFPEVTELLGYDIRFFFLTDATFERCLQPFVAQNAEHLICADIGDFFRNQRSNWQNDFAKFRNDYLEHRNVEVAKTVGQFYDPEWAETVFDAVWRTTATLLSFFLESRFPPMFSLRPNSAIDQDKDHPRMWEIIHCAPVPRTPFTKIKR